MRCHDASQFHVKHQSGWGMRRPGELLANLDHSAPRMSQRKTAKLIELDSADLVASTARLGASTTRTIMRA